MAASYPQLVLFGDSLFQGASNQDGFCFQAALQSHCIRRYDVINRGFSGYNTSQALKILPEVFPVPSDSGPKLAYLIVLLGANDAALTMPVDSQHVDLDQFKTNLTKIVTHPNIAAHKPNILLVTPPPLDEIQLTKIDLANGHPHGSRKAKLSASYAEVVRQVTAEVPGMVLIDLWKAIMDVAISKTPGFDGATDKLLGDPECGQRGYLEHLLPDGLHLNGESYKILYDVLIPHIKPEHPGLAMDGWVYPEWRVAPWLDN